MNSIACEGFISSARHFVSHCSTSTVLKLPLDMRSRHGFSLTFVDSATLSREQAKQRFALPQSDGPPTVHSSVSLPEFDQSQRLSSRERASRLRREIAGYRH